MCRTIFHRPDLPDLFLEPPFFFLGGFAFDNELFMILSATFKIFSQNYDNKRFLPEKIILINQYIPGNLRKLN